MCKRWKYFSREFGWSEILWKMLPPCSYLPKCFPLLENSQWQGKNICSRHSSLSLSFSILFQRWVKFSLVLRVDPLAPCLALEPLRNENTREGVRALLSTALGYSCCCAIRFSYHECWPFSLTLSPATEILETFFFSNSILTPVSFISSVTL